MVASSAGVRTVEAGLGPRTAFTVLVRLHHLVTFFGLMPKRLLAFARFPYAVG